MRLDGWEHFVNVRGVERRARKEAHDYSVLGNQTVEEQSMEICIEIQPAAITLNDGYCTGTPVLHPGLTRTMKEKGNGGSDTGAPSRPHSTGHVNFEAPEGSILKPVVGYAITCEVENEEAALKGAGTSSSRQLTMLKTFIIGLHWWRVLGSWSLHR